ncbi:MAG TPA: CopD family protein [Actinomycetota bacterium]|nr:CopD family protein [Actinomycetota bacterium]
MDVEDALRSIALPLVRFGGFAATALVMGIPAIILLVLRPSFSGLEGHDWDAGRAGVAARLEGFVRAALISSVATTALYLLLQATVVSELRDTDMGGDTLTSVVETSFGRWQAIRFPILAGLAAILVGKVRGSLRPGGMRAWWALWLGLGVALTATSSMSGHAAVSSPRTLAILNDVVHLVSGSIWFAGIVVLAVVLPDGWRNRSQEDGVKLLAPAVTAFSRVALVSISVVAVTGTLNSLFNVESPGDLLSSGYGRTLALKIILFLGILALGGINHFVLRRKLELSLAGGRPGGAHRAFRRTIAIELAIAIGLMALTGLLTGLARTRPSVAVGVPGSAGSVALDAQHPPAQASNQTR